MSFLTNNLYKRNIVSDSYRQTILIIKALLITSIICLFILVAIQYDFFLSAGKTVLLRFFIYSFFILGIFRIIFYRRLIPFFSINTFFRTNLLIVSLDSTGLRVAEELKKDQFFSFNIVGIVDDNKKRGEKLNRYYNNLGTLNDLDEIIENRGINEILIVIRRVPYTRLINVVDRCLNTGIVTRIHSDTLKVIANKLSVEYYSNIPVVMLLQTSINSFAWKTKRIIDIFIAFVSLIILSPLMMCIAACINISSKGPIIFKQTRIGKNGKPFSFYKFRSMNIDTSCKIHEAYVQSFIEGITADKSCDMDIFKIENDPRIFPFGRFIRKTSLDELPQLFNVLKGEMSIVGPRPALPYEWDHYDDWHKKRLNILPGCTGLWQVLGRSVVSFEDMVILDLYYISNFDFFFLLDIRILLKTFPVIFLGKGAY